MRIFVNGKRHFYFMEFYAMHSKKQGVTGLEIATDMVANATKTFNLATKKLSLVATLATMFPLQIKY